MRRAAQIGAVVVIAVAGAARFGYAHDVSIQIGRNDSKPPQLVANLSSTLLSLYPGDAEFTGRWFNDGPQLATIRVDGASAPHCRLLTGHSVALRRVSGPKDLSFLEPSTFRPILTRDGETAVFLLDSHGDFSINLLT